MSTRKKVNILLAVSFVIMGLAYNCVNNDGTRSVFRDTALINAANKKNENGSGDFGKHALRKTSAVDSSPEKQKSSIIAGIDGDSRGKSGVSAETKTAETTETVCRVRVVPEKAAVLRHGGLVLEIPAGAVSAETEIVIQKLGHTEMLNEGMKNVTGSCPGYRFLPHGTRFLKPVRLSMPYNKKLVKGGYEYENLYTYFYNDKKKRWERLRRISIDKQAGLIISRTDHFTDMINSTLTMPESPKPLGFNPNSIKDIKAADPGSGIQLINPPQAVQSGSAGLRYGIQVPPGRNGMAPSVSVSYNSDAGNGWMGVGWDVTVSSISVDTRFGVPRYLTDTESETYVWDGTVLSPTARRAELEARSGTADEPKVFQPRVEGGFSKIERYGSGPLEYWWKVTAKDGRIYCYGGTPEEGLIDAAVLKGPDGIFKWQLAEERDARGNAVRYSYVTVNDSGSGDGSGAYQGAQIYLKSIRWTDYVSGASREEGVFSLEFIRDRELFADQWPGKRRKDVTIDCRPGFKTVTADLLERIEVREGQRLIRSYGFEYKPGAFG
ncbi:MAG: SpvB/TcaC N-terminal domain-containing protein [Spirochaetia bacterium]